ncbi:TIGR02281 family clan AA aspartic protease [Novosphingobium flavum]|uniref:TIGR02281 family clan AA aspartic protease n=1 Tax=Novosphingobium aerophilum TaxID=2839843 RepID=A0A7X1F5I9_9SPHN|nr:TIGR02281 family clan AA aspartic protease [Novosphingobium aerophilum]MBC2650738.1 TIGR02281 family clan AA aspartic protease [Novosphingobium aerophilum]MBC2662098.1 TIGR02281 family clan AA aspartic protease [Novosphingobium aerophilum]
MDLAPLGQYLLSQPLLALALVSMATVLLGGLLRHLSPLLGGLVRSIGNIGLFGALLLTVMQIVRVNQNVDFGLPQLGLPTQQVSGRETRVPIARDGHFWVTASVNGVPQRFLVDTGATVTAIAPEVAEAARVTVQPMRQPILMRTANGTVPARLVTIGEVRIGNVVARDLDAVVAPGLQGTSVLGMNFLSRLASWRVEGRTLILVPHHPQEVES